MRAITTKSNMSPALYVSATLSAFTLNSRTGTTPSTPVFSIPTITWLDSSIVNTSPLTTFPTLTSLTLFKASSNKFASVSLMDNVLLNDYNYTCYSRRSEEHTSELQSRFDLVCRLLLEKKKKDKVEDEEAGDDGSAKLERRAG